MAELSREEQQAEQKTNYVLEKLSKAGIEVITDKEEFDRILEEEKILQKMETTSVEEKNPLFLADEKELKAFAQKVDDWKAGKLASTEVISEFSTSTVLQAINIPANKVSVTQDVLHKINELETVKVGKSYGHDIDIATIKKIPEFLADPVMVFDSASKSGSYVIMSETVDKNNHTIMVTMEINKQEGSVIVNNITSAYGKKDDSFFIEQIKLGNLLYQNKQKSLEWTNERGFLLPPRLTTQGSLNVTQKEDIVNKRTLNFSINDRKIEFTENQQEFLKSIGFENSLNEDGTLSKSSFFIKNTEGKKNFLKINLNVNNNSAIFVKNEEAVDDFLIYDNSHKNFIEFSMIEEADANEPLVPAEALGKVLSDYALDRLVSVDDKLMEEKFINKPDSIFVKDNLKKQLEEISFKNKVVNLPAKFISEDIYSSGIQPIGKVLQFVIHDRVAKAAGLQIPKQKHYLLEIQTDNNYEYVHNKDYPRLYEAKWDRNSQNYTDVVELDLRNFDSKTIGNIQYIAANNCNYPNPPAQTMTLSDGKTYGFAYEGKIYLNPEIMNSEVAVHEYTHLWDNYTRKTNPELWNKGLDIFKRTSLWNEVINDPNYVDIKDDENLVLSECHSRICGKIADSVLQKILERDGELTRDTVIDWDKECSQYLYNEFIQKNEHLKNEELSEAVNFMVLPMKDLFVNGLNLNIDSQNIKKENLNNDLEQTSLDNAANLLKSMKFNKDNYKELLDVINKISGLSGKEQFQVQTEEQVKNIENKQLENESVGEKVSEIPLVATLPFDPKSPIIYGKTILPSFAVLADGKLTSIENAVVKSHDKTKNVYIVDNGIDSFELPESTFKTLLQDKIEEEKKKARIAEGKTIIFEDKARGVKGTIIPEWAMFTQNGLESFKDFVATRFNSNDNSYTLTNGNTTINISADKFKEITAPERFETKFDENSPAYKKLCETEYNDFFKPRDNTAYNFRHNLEVYCRREANSPCDAFNVAKEIIRRMDKEEKKKTENLIKKIVGKNETINEFIVRTYHEAIKEMPINEDYIKYHEPNKFIARPFYDTINTEGVKIENDPALIHGTVDKNLAIGSVLKNIQIDTGKLFGHGKDSIHFDELKIVSASKENNSITVMDLNKSFLKLPRDTVLKTYKEQQEKEFKHVNRHNKSNSMQLSYGY
ncbi:MAG: hypothetical protein K6C98_02570 [Treponema sp.]|nr:hypothetical protein [Treponema sp.]